MWKMTPIFPSYIQFETNTICSGKCIFCPHDRIDRKTMSNKTIDKIINELIPLGEEVCPFLNQEPAQEPRMMSILKKIKDKKPTIKTTLYSNMTIWSKSQMRALVDDGNLDNLAISFYGPTPELYAKYQPGFDWIQTRQNIHYLLDYKRLQKSEKPNIGLHYILADDLMNELPRFRNDWENEVSIRLVPYDTFHGTVPYKGLDDVALSRYCKIKTEREPCRRLWNTFNIASNGDVIPCCVDYAAEQPLGNINEQTPMEIWEGEKYTAFRAIHEKKRWSESGICKSCGVWRY